MDTSQAGPSSQSQAPTQSQAATQGKGAAAAAKYFLVNTLEDPVARHPSDATLVYHGFVETVLQLIVRNQYACMPEEDLFNHWLPKLGLAKDHHLPHPTQKRHSSPLPSSQGRRWRGRD